VLTSPARHQRVRPIQARAIHTAPGLLPRIASAGTGPRCAVVRPAVLGQPTGMPARAPPHHRPRVEAKRDDNGRHRTALGQPRNDQADLGAVRNGTSCALGDRERLAARCTQKPLLFPRVDVHIALPSLTSGRTRPIGADDGGGVQDGSPRLAWLGSMPRRRRSGPPCLLQADLTTV
jgi:hypothetical protein